MQRAAMAVIAGGACLVASISALSAPAAANPRTVDPRTVDTAPSLTPAHRVVVGYTTTHAGRTSVRSVVAGDAQEAARVVAHLRDTPGVTAANVAVPLHRLDQPAAASRLAADPLVPYQWALPRLSARSLWTTSRGAGVTVAVIDDGVDRAHPDLAGAILRGRNIAHPSLDVDPGQHGTHVSGIIAARANNGIGGAGLAPGARVLPVDVFDGDTATDVSVAAGIVWAAQQPGVSIISMSLGGPDSTPVMRQAVRFAQARGLLLVAAAGNDGVIAASYPASYSGVLGVGATGRDTMRASFSSQGSQVDVMAPGVEILSTTCAITNGMSTTDDCTRGHNGRVQHVYEYMSGTSMATPYVSAAAALLKAAYPTLHGDSLAAALQATARDLGTPGRDTATGSGLIQPLVALRGTPGTPTRMSVSTGADSATVRWARPGWPGTAGIGSWRVWLSLDDGATWGYYRSLPATGTDCTTPCTTTITGLPAGHIVRARVSAVSPAGAVGSPANASAWLGPDAGSDLATARVLSSGVGASDVLAPAGDEDWFTFDTTGSPTTPTQVVVDGGVSGQVVQVFAIIGGVVDPSSPVATGDVGDPVGLLINAVPGATGLAVVVSGNDAPLAPFTVTATPSP